MKIKVNHSRARRSGMFCMQGFLPASGLLVLAVVLMVFPGRAVTHAADQGDPSAAYLQAYLAFQDAVRFEKKGDMADARRKYEQSLALFDGVKRSFPSWNTRMVDIRTGKVREALGMLGRGGGAAVGSATAAGRGAASGVPASAPVYGAPSYQPMAQQPQPVGQVAAAQSPGFSRGYSLTDQIQQQVAAYEEQIRQLQEANFQVTRELESQKQIVQDSVARIAAAKNQEASAMQQIAHLEQELTVAKQSNSETVALMEQEHALLKGQLEKADSRESSTREQIKQLEAELTAAREGGTQALARLEKQQALLEGQLQEASDKESSTREQIKQLEEELAASKDGNAEALARIEGERAALKNQLEKASTEGSAARQQIEHLEQELAATRKGNAAALAQMQEEQALLKNQLKEADSEESATREQIKRLEQELAVASTGSTEALARMQEEQALLRRQLEEATEGLQKANAESGMMFSLLEESKAVADRYREQRDAVIRERDQMAVLMKTSREGSESAMQELVARNGELQESLKQALDRVEQLNEATTGKDEQIAQLASEIEKLNQEGSGTDEQIAQLEAEMARMSEESGGKDEQIAQLEAEMATLNEENTGKDEQIAQLKSQVDEVRTELAIIREKSAGYVTTIADLESRLENTMAMLEEERAADDIPTELQEENELLRGLIVRQLRQQVRQQQTNQLVRNELERLEGSSRNLIDRVAKLTDERPRLSEAEKELLEKYNLSPEDEGGIGVTMVARVEPSSESSGAGSNSNVVAQSRAPEQSVASDVEASGELATRAADAFYARNFERAEQLYEDYMKTDPVAPKHGIALANLGVVRMRLRKFDAAQQALTKARAIHPDNAFIHFMLGMSHFWQDENEDALLALESACALDPKNLKVHQYIGVVATRLGNLKRAEKGFLEAIALDPRHAPAHFNLAVIYATGDGGAELYDRAEQHYLKALDTGAERDPQIERLLNEAKAVAGDEYSSRSSG
jgi:predicted  nucleic acid-binding Zn-ribbon protein